MEIISKMNALTGYEIATKVNPLFVRQNEVKILIGSNKKLISLIGEQKPYPFEETLKWMYKAQ
jgi:GDP-D-mannose dehydratase